jgi:predicted amidohydrolase
MAFIAAAIQMNTGSDKDENLARAERLIRRAAASGARLVALPEVFNWRGQRAVAASQCEGLDGPTLNRMSRLAAELRIYLVAGSIRERVHSDERSYNTSTLFAPDGTRVAIYRKIHLFDVDIPGRVSVRESETILPGTEAVCATTELGKIGMTICYDLRFPELYRELTFAGAQIVTIPSAFTFPTGEAHWEVLVRARAIENQVYVVAPAQFGLNHHGYHDYGNSMIVDPWGRVLARAGDHEECITAPIDLDYLAKVRTNLPALTHVRRA